MHASVENFFTGLGKEDLKVCRVTVQDLLVPSGEDVGDAVAEMVELEYTHFLEPFVLWPRIGGYFVYALVNVVEAGLREVVLPLQYLSPGCTYPL